jgi:hypothetical protein
MLHNVHVVLQTHDGCFTLESGKEDVLVIVEKIAAQDY